MRECDVVMKGGITSGVVYPLTIVELSKAFRLKSIGGTSAGALAAAITAAAEYNRAGGGFERIEKIPQEMATALLDFFQPSPTLKPLFGALLAAQAKRSMAVRVARAIGALVAGYWLWTLVGLALGVAVACGLWRLGWSSLCVPLLLLGAAGALVGLGWRVWRAITVDLPAADFGICSGLSMASSGAGSGAGSGPGSGKEALTDWLARIIDEVAGRDQTKDGPLTFDDLWGPEPDEPRIRLDMMTTNLSMSRAHRLPLRENTYLFRKSEFERLFPRRIVDYMLRSTRPLNDRNGQPVADFYHLPLRGKLPVVVAARLSLSFPGLISAVPLYARDRTLATETDQDVPRRCLFSDGGLTSNFPIHFFDHLLPATPTFAVSLDSWRRQQHGDERVRLPDKALQGIALPIRDVATFGSFVSSLLTAARNWQDNLQSTLPGYRERIVHVALDDDKEGGMNLDMDADTIRTLADYGRRAGRKLVDDFDLDEHRWRRFLVAVARIEESLEEMRLSYDGGADRPEAFRTFLDRYAADPETYRQDVGWLNESRRRIDALMTLARQWQAAPRFRDGRIPHPASDLRITARY